MKQSLKEYFKDIRNYFHVVVGISFGYGLAMISGFSNREKFPLDEGRQGNILACLICGVALWGGAFLWEKRQDSIRANSSDMRDVWLSSASGTLGGLTAILFPNLFVAIISCAISLVLILTHNKK